MHNVEDDIIRMLKEMQANMKKITAEIKSVREYIDEKRHDKLGFPRHWNMKVSEDDAGGD